MQKPCTQTFVYLHKNYTALKNPKPKYNPKRTFMSLKRYTCCICNNKYSSSIDDNEPKVCYSCDIKMMGCL